MKNLIYLALCLCSGISIGAAVARWRDDKRVALALIILGAIIWTLTFLTRPTTH